MRFAMMMTIGGLASSAHAQPSTAGPGGPGWVLSHQKISDTAAAYTDLGHQLFKLLPNDGAAGDRFGISVAISGAMAIVGAFYDGDNGPRSGSAYLFDTTSGEQLAKLLPNDGAAFDFFGLSVAISGANAIVGAGWHDDNGMYSGSAYLFDTTTGDQIAKLLPNDGAAYDHFGVSVAISGSTAIVGALTDDDNGISSGSAYLFDITTGQQLFKLLPNDGTAEDKFGISVAISGAIAIVGAHGDDDNGYQSGSAYLFDITTGRQLFKLLPNDGAVNDWFGVSVAIGGPAAKEVAIVGAQQHDDNGIHSGSAYLFDTITGRQIAKLLADDGAADDLFGHAVGTSGVTAIVGAFLDNDNGSHSGSAYLFDTTTGQQRAKLRPYDGAVNGWFGVSVAISGTPGHETAIVGALGDDDNGAASGAAYLFDAAGAPGKCPWDIDSNGSVGVSDLLSLLASWGPCKDCPADFDRNGAVGVADLLALLAHWGPCP